MRLHRQQLLTQWDRAREEESKGLPGHVRNDRCRRKAVHSGITEYLRSTLDVYTQAISPVKHAAQAAVLDLVFSSERNALSD
jgi:hypothetical protein